MARGGLPVDRARVHAEDVLAERLELGAVAEEALRLAAVGHVPRGEEAQRGRAHGPEVGHDGDGHVDGTSRVRRSTRPSGPRHRAQTASHAERPAAAGHERERRRSPSPAPGRPTATIGAASTPSGRSASTSTRAARGDAVRVDGHVERAAACRARASAGAVARSARRERRGARSASMPDREDRQGHVRPARPPRATRARARAGARRARTRRAGGWRGGWGACGVGHRGAGTCSMTWRDHGLGGQALDLGAGREHHAVAQRRDRERLHVVGDHEVAAAQHGERAARDGEHVRRARRGAAEERRAGPRVARTRSTT